MHNSEILLTCRRLAGRESFSDVAFNREWYSESEIEDFRRQIHLAQSDEEIIKSLEKGA